MALEKTKHKDKAAQDREKKIGKKRVAPVFMLAHRHRHKAGVPKRVKRFGLASFFVLYIQGREGVSQPASQPASQSTPPAAANESGTHTTKRGAFNPSRQSHQTRLLLLAAVAPSSREGRSLYPLTPSLRHWKKLQRAFRSVGQLPAERAQV